jgi:NitT/TauT family transport system substrate-binding protein
VKLAIPDLISPSYFPAIAAVELGFLDAELEVTRTYEDLREGRLDFVGGASHAPLYAFKDWEGCRLLCALAQHMYWFLVVKSSLDAKRGDLNAVKGLRIGAAPGPVDGLKQLLKRAGIDPAKDVQIGPVPGLKPGEPASFGLLAARALQEGKLDGFWANGMGCEIALKGGFGALLLDARRDGPDEIRGYTFPALVTSDRLIREKPEAARAARKAVMDAQKALKEDPGRATAIGRKLFPAAEAQIIAELIRRDAPYYDPAIAPQSVDSMNRFARDLGLLSKNVAYEDVVWTG